MQIIFGFSLVICMISQLFGLQSNLFDDEEQNLLDVNSATISSGAVSSDLDWTPNNPDDIFGSNSDSLLSLNGYDLIFDNSAIANACINPDIQLRRQRRRGQNQVQCGTEPPKKAETSPENIETSPTMAALYDHEVCPGYNYLVYAVCDSGNRFDRQSRGDDFFFDLTSCTLLNLNVGCFDPHRVWCCVKLETKSGDAIEDFYEGHILDALQGLFDASGCELQNPLRPVEHMPYILRLDDYLRFDEMDKR